MKVRITLDLDVGDTPTADGISYMIYQYGEAPPNHQHTPEEWAEAVVLDILDAELHEHVDSTDAWRIEGSTVEVVV